MRLLPAKPPCQPKNIYYGWIIILITALAFFFSAPGQTFFISGFTDIYVNELGWERATVSSLYSVATLISGLTIFSVGRIADKLGNKVVILSVGILLGAVCFLNSFVWSLPSLFIAFFFSRLLGQGSMTFVPSLVLPNWFVKKRAMAFSLMSIGVVVASTFVPIINAGLLKIWDWRDIWRLWGTMLWVIFVPVVLFFLFNKPGDIGLKPDNDSAVENNNGNVAVDDEADSFTMLKAMRTFPFWGMLYCQMILPLVTTGLTFHLVSIMQSKSMTVDNAALILSLFAMVSFPVTLLAGKVMDGMKQHHVAAAISVIEIIALVFLFFSQSLPMAIAFAILHGAATGLQSVNNGIVWPNYFGTRHLGSIRGVAMMGSVISSAVGPLPFGLMFAKFGNYNLALLFVMTLPVVGFVVALFSKKPIQR